MFDTFATIFTYDEQVFVCSYSFMAAITPFIAPDGISGLQSTFYILVKYIEAELLEILTPRKLHAVKQMMTKMPPLFIWCFSLFVLALTEIVTSL